VSESRVRINVVVAGLVQGVGYRYFVLDNAQELGLDGWVTNLHDGRVEAEIEGEEEIVAELITRMRKGPRLARVMEIVESPQQVVAGTPGFRVR